MENCVRCNVEGEEVRLFDAIYEGRMAKICERCSIIENVPIIKKPGVSQLKEAEIGRVGVYDRMKRLSGIKDAKEETTFFREDRLKELDKKPELELPEKEKLNLVEHFYWQIMQNRRRKGLSQKQLAEVLSESEIAIEMIEKAKFPENAEILIKKLEQFFQIRLRKLSSEELMSIEREKQKPVLLDEYGRELEDIPEPEIKQIEIEEVEKDIEKEAEIPEIEYKLIGAEPVRKETQVSLTSQPSLENVETEIPEIEYKLIGAEPVELEEVEEIKEEPELNETGDLDIRKTNIEDVTIGDLKDLSRKRIEATKQEKVEEQEKIEERQRLIEARKEELRLMREKESNELDKILGGTELLNNQGKPKLIENSDIVEEFEEELI